MAKTTAAKKRSPERPDVVETLGLPGATAAILTERASGRSAALILYVARTQRDASELYDILLAMRGVFTTAYFPPWDTPPFEGLEPSRMVTGRRMSVLRWLTDAENRPSIVVTTADALLRRVPPRSLWQNAHLDVDVGDPIDPAALERQLKRLGYTFGGHVDEAGEAAISGRVIDIFPAAASLPCRIEHENGLVREIASYDPVSQRTVDATRHLIIDPASEAVLPEDGADAPDLTTAERENRLSEHYGELETLFDYVPDAELIVETSLDRRADIFREQVREAHDLLASDGPTRRPPEPDRVFMTPDEWERETTGRITAIVAEPPAGNLAVPRFAADRRPQKRLAAFADEHGGKCLVLTAPNEPLLREMRRRAKRALGRDAEPAADWDGVRAAEPGSLLALRLPLEHGFLHPSEDLAVITATDLLGRRARAANNDAESNGVAAFDVDRLRVGDVVVHFDHGLGILEGMDEVAVGENEVSDVLTLRYADDAKLMVPAAEIGALWRYGGEEEAVKLDRLKGETWLKRRNEMVREIERTARQMVKLAKQRLKAKAAAIEPPREAFERFCDAFPFELTAGQHGAMDAVLADLASGRPMDRLLCGDVGFGKTELALRAIAAVVLSGSQVAFAAPTTVLVKQHLRNLRRRFAPFGIEVAELSRMTASADAKAVKEGLASGDIGIVVGTQALSNKDVAFADLKLAVIDEEQRFGTKEKEKLRAKTAKGHVLTLTATPIPRTLEAGFVGLHDLSIIATPPVSRQPVRTDVRRFDDALVRNALTREKRRGGQSFVVCPRIEDIAPMRDRLRTLVPDLDTVVAHGKLPDEEIDAVMLGFAEGRGDVLLATNIIESGIDVAAANTLIVWRPDRFGLAQLHQLRGRVGRSARRGSAYFLTDPQDEPGEDAMRRLQSLEDFSALGSGFAISARDLDLRGAGDLLGETQAGHMKLLGLDLYRHYLDLALIEAETGEADGDWRPEIALGDGGRIPPSYVPDEEVRINLYARLDRLADAADVRRFEAEIDDRFGEPPPETTTLLQLARLRAACRSADIAKLEGGPQAIAVTFRPNADRPDEDLFADAEWKDNRLIVRRASESGSERLAFAQDLVETILEQ